jgi:multiple sugar transport system permease protein
MSASNPVRTTDTVPAPAVVGAPLALPVRRPAKWVRPVFWTLVAAAVSPFFLAPLLWMISSALKPLRMVFAVPIQWIPHPVEWANVPATLNFFPFWHDFLNTAIITIPSMIGTMASSAVVAYGLSRVRWKGAGIIFVIALGTMMIPTYVTIIPLFLLYSKLGWVNTFYPLIVPNFFGSGFSIFLLRQFFLSQPQELYDAAWVDGAGHWFAFTRICLPLAKPALAVVGLFAFIGSWTDFFQPLVYLQTPNHFTILLGLQYLHSQHTTFWNYLMVGDTFVLLPILVIFLLAQRTFIEGIHLTGIR